MAAIKYGGDLDVSSAKDSDAKKTKVKKTDQILHQSLITESHLPPIGSVVAA
jgi:hypothetical protein